MIEAFCKSLIKWHFRIYFASFVRKISKFAARNSCLLFFLIPEDVGPLRCSSVSLSNVILNLDLFKISEVIPLKIQSLWCSNAWVTLVTFLARHQRCICCALLDSLFSGKSVSTVLSLLRDVHPSFHDALVDEFKTYSSCVGLLETGYFRRRRRTPDSVAFRRPICSPLSLSRTNHPTQSRSAETHRAPFPRRWNRNLREEEEEANRSASTVEVVGLDAFPSSCHALSTHKQLTI